MENAEHLDMNETVRLARKARPSSRFVLLTLGGGPPVREAGRTIGANAMITRPFAVRDLIEAVEPGSSMPPKMA